MENCSLSGAATAAESSSLAPASSCWSRMLRAAPWPCKHKGRGIDSRPQPRNGSLSTYKHASGAGLFDPGESSCLSGCCTTKTHSINRCRPAHH